MLITYKIEFEDNQQVTKMLSSERVIVQSMILRISIQKNPSISGMKVNENHETQINEIQLILLLKKSQICLTKIMFVAFGRLQLSWPILCRSTPAYQILFPPRPITKNSS